MAVSEKLQEKEAQHGQKMVEVKLRFWTSNIAEGEGKIVLRHAWAGEVVRIERNDALGSVPGDSILFHSMLDVGWAIEKCHLIPRSSYTLVAE